MSSSVAFYVLSLHIVQVTESPSVFNFFLKTELNRGMVEEWRERETEGGEEEEEEGCENCRWLPPRAQSLW